MAADSFRDAIYEAVDPYIEDNCGPFQHMDIVDAIFDMPEMEQIRQYIKGTLEDWCCIECRDANVDLSNSVIDWALREGES